jgi:glycosyltransferase involved in cell wall biosynthesis
MKIAFISTVHGHSWPGSEYLWAATADMLLAKGHQVYARCSAGFSLANPLQQLIGEGLIYDPVRSPKSRTQRLLDRYLDSFRKMKEWNPDLVVVSAGSAFDISYQPALAKYLLETLVPFIPICHFNAETFWVDEPNRATMRRVYGKSAASVFVCADNHRITERQLALKIEKFHVIPPPFPLVLKEPLPWPVVLDDCWNFACVARLESRWKGQDVLLEVLGRSEWRQRRWKLNLYGEGSEEGYLRNLAQHYGIQDRLVFHGFVSDRSEIWLSNHIQVFPTRGEGGPMVLTEGMMAGRCAVISDCGNAREYVQDGADGFLVDFPTANTLAKTLDSAWMRRSEWCEMGAAAHRKAKSLLAKIPAHEKLFWLLMNYECKFPCP